MEVWTLVASLVAAVAAVVAAVLAWAAAQRELTRGEVWWSIEETADSTWILVNTGSDPAFNVRAAVTISGRTTTFTTERLDPSTPAPLDLPTRHELNGSEEEEEEEEPSDGVSAEDSYPHPYFFALAPSFRPTPINLPEAGLPITLKVRWRESPRGRWRMESHRWSG